MKRTLLFLVCTLASMAMQAQQYFPEGTKWTEIRLDTLKYDSWYSKDGDKWVPNFETIEYYVKGEFIDRHRGDGKDKYRCIYTNGPEWTDSLTLMIQEEGDAEYVEQNSVMVSVLVYDYDGKSYPIFPGMAYQFDWSVGKDIHYMDILSSNLTGWFSNPQTFGTIEEIKEKSFGGETPLKYVDLNGVRIVHGIGVTEWNDGECLFGPPDPYSALAQYPNSLSGFYPERHYRSMLVHFERNGEVLYDVWPAPLSQTAYRPLLEEGKVWKYSYNSFVREYMKSLTISGDTIIGNQTYKKIIDVASQAVEMALREEDKKVYCCYPNRDTEILLYDFGKNAGDIISKEVKDGDTWIRKVISVDTVMVKGNAFRCMKVDEYIIHGMTEEEFFAGNYGYSTGFWIEGIGSFTYLDSPIPQSGNYYTFYECSIGDMTINQKDFLDLIIHDNLPEYRPFVEDDKVWKVGDVTSGNPVQLVDYYFFDDDTIINGKTCKQMMRKRYVSPEHPNFDFLSQKPSLIYVGAWYEEDKKVYLYDTTLNQFTMMYDFSLEDNGTFQINDLPYVYVVGPRQTGGMKGFKGVYRDVWEWADGESYKCAPWMEGIGIIYAPPTINICNVELTDPLWFLMECYVGDEVIYLNDKCEDGATPELSGARKHRFDFTHTTKIQPKTRTRSEAEPSLYGEYSEHQLNIHLDPINDAYQVSITDASGKVAYQKTIDAGNIVGLNIDISSYPKGYYNVTVENDNESFTGTFEAQTTGIMDVRKKAEEARDRIYNLQGQRLNSLQKGLNIVNGQKVYVK